MEIEDEEDYKLGNVPKAKEILILGIKEVGITTITPSNLIKSISIEGLQNY